MEYHNNHKFIGIDAIVFAVYIASTPLHQTLVLSNGGTVTKYLAFGAMLACLTMGVGRFRLDRALAGKLLLVAIWFGLTVGWSRSPGTTVSSLVSIFSYMSLMIVVGSKQWSQKEKQLFSVSLLIAASLIALSLIQSAASTKRATITWSGSGVEADQNILAGNIGLGIPFAIFFLLRSSKPAVRFLMIAIILLIVAGVIATGSRGAMIAVIGAVLYYFLSSRGINRKQKFRLVFFVLVFSFGVFLTLSKNLLNNVYIVERFTVADDTASGRTQIWLDYLTMLFHRWRGFLVGFGYGASGLEYADYFHTNWPYATHNDILWVLTGSGTIGLYLVAKFIRLVWKRSKLIGNQIGRACIVLMLLAGLSVNMFDRYGWWNAMIFAYIGFGVDQNEESETRTA